VPGPVAAMPFRAFFRGCGSRPTRWGGRPGQFQLPVDHPAV